MTIDVEKEENDRWIAEVSDYPAGKGWERDSIEMKQILCRLYSSVYHCFSYAKPVYQLVFSSLAPLFTRSQRNNLSELTK